MTINKLDFALPPTSAAPGATGKAAEKAAGGNSAAWLREMERQEMGAWLNHGPLPAATREQRLFPTAAQALPAAQTADPATDRIADDARSADAVTPAAGPGAAAIAAPAAREANAVAGEAGMAADASSAQVPAKAMQQAPASIVHAVDAGSAAAGRMNGPEPARQDFVRQVMSQLDAGRGGTAAQVQAPDMVRLQPNLHEPADSAVPAPVAPLREAVPDRTLAAMQPRRPAGKPVRAGESGEPAEARRAAPPSLDRDADPGPALRVHAFWSDEAVRIWVGTDRSAALGAQQLAGALQDLKRLLRQQGTTLASLTVNGETLFDPDEAGAAAGGLEPVRIQGQP